jgi:hypothetical protein
MIGRNVLLRAQEPGTTGEGLSSEASLVVSEAGQVDLIEGASSSPATTPRQVKNKIAQCEQKKPTTGPPRIASPMVFVTRPLVAALI